MSRCSREVTTAVAKKDFLDEIVEERTRANPDFPELVEAATRSRSLLRSLADRRRELGLSQTLVAAKMGTSQSALARLEGGESDPRISTIERYALAIGSELELRTDGD
jgi:ribosome-binding protein aMBF1 (putative translation factor)